jgi:hypothetical protein
MHVEMKFSAMQQFTKQATVNNLEKNAKRRDEPKGVIDLAKSKPISQT